MVELRRVTFLPGFEPSLWTNFCFNATSCYCSRSNILLQRWIIAISSPFLAMMRSMIRSRASRDWSRAVVEGFWCSLSSSFSNSWQNL